MKNVLAVTAVTAVALISMACAGVVPEEPGDEATAPQERTATEEEATPPAEENVGQASSPLCLHRCVEIWGGCRVCYCESGDARVICYPSVASASLQKAGSDAPRPSLAPAGEVASP